MGGGGHIKIVSKNSINELFSGKYAEKESSFFDVLETMGGGGRFENCLQETKYELFLFCKHSLIGFQAWARAYIGQRREE